MKRTIKLVLTVSLIAAFFAMGSVAVHGAEFQGYDRAKALSYADAHYLDKKAYDGDDQDCVKFVKKCVEAGGVPVEKGRTYGYTPKDYVNYIVKNGWAKAYKLKLTAHDWSVKQGKVRYYVDGYQNQSVISPGDMLVYICKKSKCPKSYFHVELIDNIEGEVTCYGHNPSKGPNSLSSSGKHNNNVITFSHTGATVNKKYVKCGSSDKQIEIWVLHFSDDPGLFCKHASVQYTVDEKATFGEAGQKTGYCNDCGQNIVKTIPAINKVYLAKTSYAYSGKAMAPSVTVQDTAGKKLTKSSSTETNGFVAAYEAGRKNVGTYAVNVTLTGPEYEGAKKLAFNIVPAGTSVTKVSAVKKGFKVKWKKQAAKMSASRITGYQIRYSTSSKMTKAKTVTVKGYTKTSKTIKKLKAKKTYYVQVRTYQGKYASSWTKAKKIKTK